MMRMNIYICVCVLPAWPHVWRSCFLLLCCRADVHLLPADVHVLCCIVWILVLLLLLPLCRLVVFAL